MTLSATQTIWRTGVKPNYSVFRKSTIEQYQREESRDIVITHVQACEDGSKWMFLQSYGLSDWAVREF